MEIQKLLKGYTRFWILGRFHRPIGIWLIFFPALWGLALGAGMHPSLGDVLLFFIAACCVRGGGCVLNDLIDRKFDAHVARTKDRPLVTGEVTPLEAMIFAGLLLGLAFLILLMFPLGTILFGLVGAVLIGTYPWLKRFTYWPQIFLGLMMNWGIWMGVAAHGQPINMAVICIFLGALLWTLGYDTIYAFQDMDDDAIIGVKSSALAVRDNPHEFLTWVYSAAFILWAMGGIFKGVTLSYILALSAVAVMLILQVHRLNLKNQELLNVLFRMNQWVGIVLFLGLVM